MNPVTVSGSTERTRVERYHRGRPVLAKIGRKPAVRITRWVRFDTTESGMRYAFTCTLTQVRTDHEFDDAQVYVTLEGHGITVDADNAWGPTGSDNPITIPTSVVASVRESFNQLRAVAEQLGDALDALPSRVLAA